MMWAHGWLSRQASESAALEDVARAAKCQKNSVHSWRPPVARGRSEPDRQRVSSFRGTKLHGPAGPILGLIEVLVAPECLPVLR
jgi:hypothetical protein